MAAPFALREAEFERCRMAEQALMKIESKPISDLAQSHKGTKRTVSNISSGVPVCKQFALRSL